MTYVAVEMTPEFAARIITDTTLPDFRESALRYASENEGFPEGFVLDVENDSYLVIEPFCIPDPMSTGDYSFRYKNRTYRIMFISPSISNFSVRDEQNNVHLPDGEFLRALTDAFACHHSVIRVINGKPVPRGSIRMPNFKAGE